MHPHRGADADPPALNPHVVTHACTTTHSSRLPEQTRLRLQALIPGTNQPIPENEYALCRPNHRATYTPEVRVPARDQHPTTAQLEEIQGHLGWVGNEFKYEFFPPV
jgi:hypothetical protein